MKGVSLDENYGRISAGYRADIIYLDEQMQVQAVWISGQTLLTQ